MSKSHDAAPTSPRSAKELRAELAPIIVGHVCLHAAMTGARMAAPLLALGLGHGKAAAGVLVALFALTQVFMSLPAGRFADRNGLKRPMGLCVVVTSVGAGLAAVWPVYPVLCLTALLCGGAVGAATIVLQRHVGHMAANPTELKQVFSWLAIAPAASSFVGPVAAGLMIDQAGFRASFLMLACLPMLAWVLLRRACELPHEEPPAARGGAAWDLLRDARMRQLLLMNWFMASAWDLHGFMVPVLGHERGLPASVIGSILGAFAIAAALIRVVLPFLARGLQEWALITGATLTVGILLLLYPLMPSALAMGLCSAALGMSMGAVHPMIMSMLHQITPRHRHGEALAVRLVMLNVSGFGMPMLFGAAGGLVGVSAVFWVMGLVVVCGSRVGVALRGMDVHRAGPP